MTNNSRRKTPALTSDKNSLDKHKSCPNNPCDRLPPNLSRSDCEIAGQRPHRFIRRPYMSSYYTSLLGMLRSISPARNFLHRGHNHPTVTVARQRFVRSAFKYLYPMQRRITEGAGSFYAKRDPYCEDGPGGLSLMGS